MKLTKQAIDEFERRLQDQIELLSVCETDAGYFERIAASFIPFLRRDPISAPIVERWQKACTDMSFVNKANEQLKIAFEQLWDHAKKNGNRLLRRQLVQILRKVKGPSPYIEICSSGLPRTISSALRPLYAEHIAKAEIFTFAPGVYELEKRSSEFDSLADNDASFLWTHMITLENCRILKNDSLFALRWKTLNGDRATMGIRAFAARQDYSLTMTAAELRVLDTPAHKPHYFIRKKFERHITRLRMELLSELHRLEPEIKKSDRNNLKRMDVRLDDKAIGTEKMRGYFEANPSAKLNDAAVWLDREVKAKRVVLSAPKQVTTYKTWARVASIQPSEAKVRGKDKTQRKSCGR